MIGSLNKVLLIGRLGADPEIKQMVNGKCSQNKPCNKSILGKIKTQVKEKRNGGTV